MEITVEKSPYKKMTMTNPVRIEKKKEFSIVVPEEVKAGLDESIQKKISVINTGQTDFDSITLSVRGISTDWYTMAPMTINNLTAGEEKIVTMNLKVPSKYCEEECQIYHFVDIIAKAGTQEKVQSFSLELDQNATKEVVSSEGFELPSLPTGNVVESVSNPYVAVIIFILVGFILISFTKDNGMDLGGITSKLSFSGGSKKKYNLNKSNFRGGKVKTPTFFKKKRSGYRSPSDNAPYNRRKSGKRNVPRESVVPVLHRVKKSSKEWNN